MKDHLPPIVPGVPPPLTAARSGVARLRLLATTDLHMQLLGHDYVRDTPGPHPGLAGLSTLIAEARAEAAAAGQAVLLLDNGDFLQGNALASELARRPVAPDHPLVAAFNHLRYDAVGLGNHDFDFGLPYLGAVLQQLSMPVLCANLRLRGTGLIRSGIVLECPLPDGSAPLRVGLTSILPEATARWNQRQLQGWAEVLPIVPSLQTAVAKLRRDGAEVVVVLAHLGIADPPKRAPPCRTASDPLAPPAHAPPTTAAGTISTDWPASPPGTPAPLPAGRTPMANGPPRDPATSGPAPPAATAATAPPDPATPCASPSDPPTSATVPAAPQQQPPTPAEPDAAALAQIPGVDVLITGHSHRRFPGPDHAATGGIDPDAGLLHHRPAAMAGADGSDLAVIDLTVQRPAPHNATSQPTTGRPAASQPDVKAPPEPPRLHAHRSSLRINTAALTPDPDIARLCQPAHAAARRHLASPVGWSDHPLHSFFAMAAPTALQHLVACAMIRAIRAPLAKTRAADLPLLACTTARVPGAGEGPEHFLNIAPGMLRRRHLAGIAPYADDLCVVEITGTEVRRWLEHASRVFARLSRPDPPDAPDNWPPDTPPPLLDPAVPGFVFDTMHGLTYGIDPTRPQGQRITDLCHGEAPVAPDARFAVVTTPFRTSGGAGLPPLPADSLRLRQTQTVETALAAHLACATPLEWDAPPPWQFRAPPGTTALLWTSPQARDHLPDIAPLRPAPLHQNAAGFLGLRLHL